MRPDRRVASVVPVLVLALLLSACVASAPIDDADPEGTLTTWGFEPTADPHYASFVTDIEHIFTVFEPLLRLDAKTARPLPGAAKDLPQVSADGLTYRLTLRDDGKFSDGTPVRASDFAYSFARLCDPAIKGTYASIGYVIVGCAEWSQLDPAKDPAEKQRAAKQKLTSDGIRVVGEKEISFTLVDPAAYFPSILALWVGVPVRESDVLRGGEQWTEPATYVGNGPFVMTTWKHEERMILTPNRFHRSPPRLKSWTRLMFGTQPAVALNAYRHGEIDEFQAGGIGAAPLMPQIEADQGLRKELTRGSDACTNAIGFNTRKAPFDDPSVRLAFAKALDRQAYVREVLGGLALPAASWIPPGLPGHDPADMVQAFDPAEARRLLAASRYADSAALRTIVIPIGANLFNRQRLDWIRGQWQQHLGVEVRIERFDDGSVLNQLYRREETIPTAFLYGWCADYPDQQNWLSLLFDSKSTQFPRRSSGLQNAEFDRLVRAADREPDRARRDLLYQEAQRLFSKEAIVAYLNTGAYVRLRKPWVRGVVDSPWYFQKWDGVYIAKKKK